jgi:hypothetical protein
VWGSTLLSIPAVMIFTSGDRQPIRSIVSQHRRPRTTCGTLVEHSRGNWSLILTIPSEAARITTSEMLLSSEPTLHRACARRTSTTKRVKFTRSLPTQKKSIHLDSLALCLASAARRREEQDLELDDVGRQVHVVETPRSLPPPIRRRLHVDRSLRGVGFHLVKEHEEREPLSADGHAAKLVLSLQAMVQVASASDDFNAFRPQYRKGLLQENPCVARNNKGLVKAGREAAYKQEELT